MLDWLSNYMTFIINGLGGVILVLLSFNCMKLFGHKTQLQEAVDRKKTSSYINSRTHEIVEKKDDEMVTPDTIRLLETKFNRDKAIYLSLAQIIPIFPLFGILGTVAGLIVMLSQGSEAAEMTQNMMNGMGTAMYTTLYGLVWTIALKFFVAFFSTRAIEESEILIDDYDKKFNNSYMMNNIVNGDEE